MLREAHAWSSGAALAVGVPLNLLLCWLIRWRTPKEMRDYSRILLQTCLIDLFVLGISELTQPVNFVSGRWYVQYSIGWTERWEPRGLKFAVYLLWMYAFLLVFFNATVQFGYRFITLNLDKNMTLRDFCGFMAGVHAFLCVSAAPFALLGYPNAECLDEVGRASETAAMLELTQNSDNNQNLTTSPGVPGLVTCLKRDTLWFKALFISYFLTIVLNCALIATLGLRMWAFVNKNLKGNSVTSTEKIKAMNRQLLVNLAIQAALPAFGFIPIAFNQFVALFVLDFEATGEGVASTMLLVSVTSYWVSALNPLVTILTVRSYRRQVESQIRRVFRLSPTTTTVGTTQQQQPQKPVYFTKRNKNVHRHPKTSPSSVVVASTTAVFAFSMAPLKQKY